MVLKEVGDKVALEVSKKTQLSKLHYIMWAVEPDKLVNLILAGLLIHKEDINLKSPIFYAKNNQLLILKFIAARFEVDNDIIAEHLEFIKQNPEMKSSFKQFTDELKIIKKIKISFGNTPSKLNLSLILSEKNVNFLKYFDHEAFSRNLYNKVKFHEKIVIYKSLILQHIENFVILRNQQREQEDIVFSELFKLNKFSTELVNLITNKIFVGHLEPCSAYCRVSSSLLDETMIEDGTGRCCLCNDRFEKLKLIEE